MSLPLRLPKDQMESQWKSQIDPILANPTNSVQILKNINLSIGANVINHRLGQMLQGWYLVDINGPAVIYRSAPASDLTLTLTSDAVVQISLGVF